MQMKRIVRTAFVNLPGKTNVRTCHRLPSSSNEYYDSVQNKTGLVYPTAHAAESDDSSLP